MRQIQNSKLETLNKFEEKKFEKGAAALDFEFCASSLSRFLVFLTKSSLVSFRMLMFVVGTFFRKESATNPASQM